MTRALKYTLFDATKELAFIPLSKECKLKGKAAIDGIGSRIGKSGGSIIHQGLLLCFGSVASSTPYVGVILFRHDHRLDTRCQSPRTPLQSSYRR